MFHNVANYLLYYLTLFDKENKKSIFMFMIDAMNVIIFSSFCK